MNRQERNHVRAALATAQAHSLVSPDEIEDWEDGFTSFDEVWHDVLERLISADLVSCR